jgi:hypothetical protein
MDGSAKADDGAESRSLMPLGPPAVQPGIGNAEEILLASGPPLLPAPVGAERAAAQAFQRMAKATNTRAAYRSAVSAA